MASQQYRPHLRGTVGRGLRRAAIIAFCWLTAAYAFVAASPFSYQEIIRPNMFGTGAFARWHVLLFWFWFGLTLVDLRPALADSTRVMAMLFVLVWGVLGTALTIHPMVPELRDNSVSLLFGIGAL